MLSFWSVHRLGGGIGSEARADGKRREVSGSRELTAVWEISSRASVRWQRARSFPIERVVMSVERSLRFLSWLRIGSLPASKVAFARSVVTFASFCIHEVSNGNSKQPSAMTDQSIDVCQLEHFDSPRQT